jgi:ATP-dependent DNA helicase RecG
METLELLEIAVHGEDSDHQFKVDVTNSNSLVGEMVAFANSGGGKILIGVDDDGTVNGLGAHDVRRVNQLVAGVATMYAEHSIDVRTENVAVSSGVVVVVTIADGLSKPYMDNSGVVWVRRECGKRPVTSPEELQRMLQQSQLLHGDEVPVRGSSISDVDREYFQAFFEKHFGHKLDEEELSLGQVLTNMNLLSDSVLTVSGVLLFGKNPQPLLPAFQVKAVAYPGVDIHVSDYRDSEDFQGNLESQFQGALSFVKRNTHRKQNGQSVNTQGELEIPEIVLEELLANAVIHRDYFVSAPVRVFVFDDRIEIISPGHLPNNLTIANIKSGNSNIRNPILASYATRVLPYRGLGNGILRAVKAYPDIEFEDDRDGNLFRVTIRRSPLENDDH